ncbi:hypothetical protein CCHL11_02157 [Colletotrichum chlorophyti]|uniref:54S ribosomal protein L28, mitochondrial n=1 Tax=Colletotrichum chlorophyti TaxID=708187 RepID=A0A1Q8S6Z5_9PEZI|nr:hypothetical protein CCHL11_02157 [Colletotrichum chlorophyti]
MASLASLRGLKPTTLSPVTTLTRAFSTTETLPARKQSNPGGTPEYAARVANIRQQLFAQAPPPLRMARNRHLRHWTIHRAWLLLQRQQREQREKELCRIQQSMYHANEVLRNTSGPGTREEGWLYRVAQEKKGIYGPGAIPIEYARYQTETPARVAWNHDWKR